MAWPKGKKRPRRRKHELCGRYKEPTTCLDYCLTTVPHGPCEPCAEFKERRDKELRVDHKGE